MGSPFKRRKLYGAEEPEPLHITLSSTASEAAPLPSLSQSPLGNPSHDSEKIAVFAQQGSRVPPKIEEVHVKVKEYRAHKAHAADDGVFRHRLGRRQAVSVTGDLPASTASTQGVSALVSVGIDGPSLTSSTISSTISSTSSGAQSSPSTSETSTVSTSTAPQVSSTDSTNSTLSSSTTPSSLSSSSTSSSAVVLSSTTTNGTSETSSSSTSISPEGIIGLSKTTAVPASTTSHSISRNGTSTISSGSLVPAIISAASARNSSSTNSGLLSTGASTSDRASSTGSSTAASITNSHSTDLFAYFFTTLADGRVTSIPESRTFAVSTLSDGTVSTSYGSFTPVVTSSPSASDSASSSDASASSSPSSSSGASDSSASETPVSTIVRGTVTSVVYATAADGASATSAGSTSTANPAVNAGSSNGSSNTPPASVLAGGIVGGVAGLAALLLAALIFVRWYRRRGAASMERINAGPDSGPADTGFVSRTGPGMAERAGLLPLAGMFRGRHGQDPMPAGERGFERVGGRKLPSAYSGGMTGPDGPSRRPIPMPAVFENNGSSHGQRNFSNTSFYQDNPGLDSSEEEHNPFGDPRTPETLQPGPARQAAIHPGGPYNFSAMGSYPQEQNVNLLQGRAATPINAPHAGSRFAEQV